MKKAFKVKEKAFLIIFKGLSVGKNYLRPEYASLRTLGKTILLLSCFLVLNSNGIHLVSLSSIP